MIRVQKVFIWFHQNLEPQQQKVKLSYRSTTDYPFFKSAILIFSAAMFPLWKSFL